LQNELYKPKEIISLEDNKFTKGLTPLKRSFSMSDVGSHNNKNEDESEQKIGDLIPLNNGTSEQPKVLKFGVQCSEEEKTKLLDLFREFKDVFSWSYEDLRGFDPSIIQHAILIKEEAKLVR
jgi:hypothetical protein